MSERQYPIQPDVPTGPRRTICEVIRDIYREGRAQHNPIIMELADEAHDMAKRMAVRMSDMSEALKPPRQMDHIYEAIPGWTGFLPLYAQMVKEAHGGCHFVEVGAYLGRSASFMAVEIINSGKKIKFDVVDLWRVPEGSTDNVFAKVPPDFFPLFEANVAPVRKWINVRRMPSVEAAASYQDGSLDFVFIDACHEFDAVVEDIRAWRPKMKQGGVMAGDDYSRSSVRKAVGQELGKLGVTSMLKNNRGAPRCWLWKVT